MTTLLRTGGVTLAVALGACSGDAVQPAAIQDRLTLQNFTSCSELEQYIEDTAVRDMRATLDSYKNGGGRVFAGAEDGAASPSAGGTGAGPTSYTTTNTQVAGVDEADFMKNDGTRIFVLAGQTLWASTSWPPERLALTGKLQVEGYPTQMYLDKDQNRVIVFSSVYYAYPGVYYGGSGGGAPIACDALGGGCGGYSGNTTKITTIDVSDLAAMKVTGEHYLPGSYANSRRVGSSVRVVLSDGFRWPEKMQWWPTTNDPSIYQDQVRYQLWLSGALEALKDQNEVLIRAQTLRQWLPQGKRRVTDGSLVDVSYACSDFSRSNAPVKLGVLTVATLNLASDNAVVSRTSIIGETGQVYASKKALYVATPHWWWWAAPGQKDYTYFHKFDITQPDRAQYVASGGVEGHILDQFSMDENDAGYFRVATTIGTRVPDLANPQNRWGVLETTNRVTVLGERTGALSIVGQTPDLEKGERIYSSRFQGDKGYLVTFRQIDPLLTLDLSTPQRPKVVGELKVPGFSTYLQPIDAKHLLAIGTYIGEPDASGQIDWQARSMKLTLFDVSDFAKPVEKFTQKVGTAYGWSEAAYEHKAFNYFAERKLLAIPFSDYTRTAGGNYWDSFVSDLRVYDVDTATGFRERGRLSFKNVFQVHNDYGWTYYWSPWVRRSVMADDNGTTYAYAVSDAGVRVAKVDNLAAPLATALFGKSVVK